MSAARPRGTGRAGLGRRGHRAGGCGGSVALSFPCPASLRPALGPPGTAGVGGSGAAAITQRSAAGPGPHTGPRYCERDPHPSASSPRREVPRPPHRPEAPQPPPRPEVARQAVQEGASGHGAEGQPVRRGVPRQGDRPGESVGTAAPRVPAGPAGCPGEASGT